MGGDRGNIRFADRAKQIKNKPRVQMDPKDAKIAELEDRVKTCGVPLLELSTHFLSLPLSSHTILKFPHIHNTPLIQ